MGEDVGFRGTRASRLCCSTRGRAATVKGSFHNGAVLVLRGDRALCKSASFNLQDLSRSIWANGDLRKGGRGTLSRGS